jgi:hypothetical protein
MNTSNARFAGFNVDVVASARIRYYSLHPFYRTPRPVPFFFVHLSLSLSRALEKL